MSAISFCLAAGMFSALSFSQCNGCTGLDAHRTPRRRFSKAKINDLWQPSPLGPILVKRIETAGTHTHTHTHTHTSWGLRV